MFYSCSQINPRRLCNMRFIPFLIPQIKHVALKFSFSSRKRPSAFESLSHEWFQVRANVSHNLICVSCVSEHKPGVTVFRMNRLEKTLMRSTPGI